MDNCIIFGSGYYGKRIYYKVRDFFNIIKYVDNNKQLWGTELNGVEIVNPKEICNYKVDIVIIASESYEEIAKQLDQMGIFDYLVVRAGFLYKYDMRRILVPYDGAQTVGFKSQNERSILFVQALLCIRTIKIAEEMKKNGWNVSLAYSLDHPQINNREYEYIFNEIYPINTMEGFVKAVDKSTFSIVHVSNSIDYLTNLLVYTNKKIVHDTHDLVSIYRNVSEEQMVAEYVANVKAHGVIYTSEKIKKIVKAKFGIKDDKIFILENLISDFIYVEKYYEKLSSKDGCIHCVYEGGMSDQELDFRFFEKIWSKITDEGIHIHFYTNFNEEYCRRLEEKNLFLHYEGNKSSLQLASEMTKYDCGLLLFNVNPTNRLHLETATANKVYEYLNSGIPIISGEVDAFSEFVTENKIGCKLDLTKNIFKQIKDACSIKINKNFLKDNNLTLDMKTKDLIAFYEYIMKG